MAIRFAKYDMDPVYESDEVVFEAMRREERKVAAATVDVIYDQEHTTSDGKEVVSHLICVPKGMPVPDMVRAVFSLDIAGRQVARGPWRPISDRGSRCSTRSTTSIGSAGPGTTVQRGCVA
jgi:hypothetical protein